MIFLIEYNRKQGKIITFEKYDDANKEQAWNKRFQMELDHLRQTGSLTNGNEVVILDGDSEETIRRTHRRYFETLEQLLTIPSSCPTGEQK